MINLDALKWFSTTLTSHWFRIVSHRENGQIVCYNNIWNIVVLYSLYPRSRWVSPVVFIPKKHWKVLFCIIIDAYICCYKEGCVPSPPHWGHSGYSRPDSNQQWDHDSILIFTTLNHCRLLTDSPWSCLLFEVGFIFMTHCGLHKNAFWLVQWSSNISETYANCFGQKGSFVYIDIILVCSQTL